MRTCSQGLPEANLWCRWSLPSTEHQEILHHVIWNAAACSDRELQQELVRLMEQTGLTAESDKMPLDEGIKQGLPDKKIR